MSTQTASTVAANELTLTEQVFIVSDTEAARELSHLIPGAPSLEATDGFDPLLPSVLVGDSARLFHPKIRQAVTEDRARVIFILDGKKNELPPEAQGFTIFGFLARPLHARVVESMVQAALENLSLAAGRRQVEHALRRAYSEIDELNRIGVALSAERDTQKLLTLIIQKAREITQSDAGSLYLVEENPQTGDKVLRFTITQNESVEVPFSQFTFPIDKSRISAYVALTGEPLNIEDAYRLPPGVPYGFSTDFDKRIGYRQKSMLTVPMKNHKGEIVGVVQLMNHKRDTGARVTPENVDEVVFPYPERAQQLVLSMASQAAVALENNRLVEDIRNLFESFVNASVVAIEARDPTTSGHSFRVKELTVALAEAVDRCDDGPYASTKFTLEQIKEIRYAAVLHDFGKVGVREQVLVKANKLYPHQLDIVKERFNYVRKALQEEHSRKKLEHILERGREEYLARLPEFEADYAGRLKEMDDFFQFVLECNRPTVLPEGNFEKLVDIAGRKYLDWSGEEKPILVSDEVRLLSVHKGSLDEAERREIESHVIHTFNFLAQIPWTKEIRNVPLIARAHHEKLDGSGYPFKLLAPEIPVQSRMMTISDIYDALSASDRPYKRAVPPDKALAILESEVKQKLMDEDLFRIFLAREIWKLTLPK